MYQWSFPSFVLTSKELFAELECKSIYFHTYCLKVNLSKDAVSTRSRVYLYEADTTGQILLTLQFNFSD